MKGKIPELTLQKAKSYKNAFIEKNDPIFNHSPLIMTIQEIELEKQLSPNISGLEMHVPLKEEIKISELILDTEGNIQQETIFEEESEEEDDNSFEMQVSCLFKPQKSEILKPVDSPSRIRALSANCHENFIFSKGMPQSKIFKPKVKKEDFKNQSFKFLSPQCCPKSDSDEIIEVSNSEETDEHEEESKSQFGQEINPNT